MEFCSKYGYDYGFEGSDEDEMEEFDSQEKKNVKKSVRKADSNIIAVKFDSLANETFAGEPKKCTHCQAIVSLHSLANIKSDSNNKLIWTCEFCETINDLSLQMTQSLDEIPKIDDVTYLIEPAAQNEPLEVAESDSKVKSNDNNYLTYCIDISGSMDTQIPTTESGSEKISRLKGVQTACLESLFGLKESEPNKRVSLVTFSDGVKYFGDATASNTNEPLINTSRGPQIYAPRQQRSFSIRSSWQGVFGRNTNTNTNQDEIPTEILNNKEKMLALAQNQSGDLKSVSKSHDRLAAIIKSLRTEGSTALGPALVFSIGYLSRYNGSQIILCTDGEANIGMGSVLNNSEAENFYDQLADYAKSKGITVNIISMQGTDCKLALLGRVADKTNGTMNIVNPNNLSEQFKSILDNRIVATSVKATLIVNYKYLYLRDKELEDLETKVIDSGNKEEHLEKMEQIKKSKLARDIGNANIDTEINFEYGIRRQKTAQAESKLGELPFQLQIEYIHNGAKFLRVYTKKQEFTKERNEALNNLLSEEMIWANGMQKMSEHALQSNIVYSNYRSHALDMLSNERNMIKPNALYQQQAFQLNIMSSKGRDQKSSNFLDEEAVEFVKNKKTNRKNLFSKK